MCFVIHRILENGTTNVHSEKKKLDSIIFYQNLYKTSKYLIYLKINVMESLVEKKKEL